MSGNILSVAGNVTFTGANSPLLPAAFASTGFVSSAGAISNDILVVEYGLQINAPAQVNLQGVFLPGKTYYLIAAGAGSGAFAQYANTDQTTLMKFVTAEVQYGSTPAPATVYVTPQSSFVTAAQTKNQAATATAIDTAGNLGTYGTDGNILLDRLIANNSQATAPAAFNALSGEGITGQQQTAFNAGNMFATAMMDQATIWSSGRENMYMGMKDGGMKDAGYAGAVKSAARLWASGFGQEASLNGNSSVGSASLSSRASGFAAGMDYEATRNFLLGFAGGYSYSNFSVSDRATSGTVEGAHGGIYGVAHSGSVYLAGAGEFAHYDNKTSRTVAYSPLAAIGGLYDETQNGKFSSDEWLGRLEAGYKAGWVTPFAGFQYASLGNGAFSETSPSSVAAQAGCAAPCGTGPVAGLHVNAHTAESEKVFAGLQLDTKTGVAGWMFSPYARLSWEHELSPDRSNTAYLLSLPDASFTVSGAAAAQDVARVQTGIKADVTSAVGVFASFDGEFSGRGEAYAGTGGLTIRW